MSEGKIEDTVVKALGEDRRGTVSVKPVKALESGQKKPTVIADKKLKGMLDNTPRAWVSIISLGFGKELGEKLPKMLTH